MVKKLSLLALAVGFPLAASTLFTGCNGTASPSALTIKDGDKKGSHISISEITAEVQVSGRVAETTLTVVFANSSSRVLEAMLDLPLPAGASISRYALEVNGKMREGVIVDKEQGRVAFENTIRRGIDPGLLEKTKGNRFRTRIYPVPAKGTKRVILSYTETLTTSSVAGSTLSYTLPVSTSKRLKSFQLNISASHPSTHISATGKLSKITQKTPSNFSMSAKYYRARDMKFTITPAAQSSDVILQRGRDGRSYFYATDYHGKAQLSARRKPKKLLIVWDASHSGLARKTASELSLLDGYFQHLGNVEVRLHILRNDLGDAGNFKVINGDWSTLRNYLSKVQYDGATKLGSINLAKSGFDQYFYFGDGLNTFDDRAPVLGSRPIFAINSSLNADHSLLQNLATRTSGAYINLLHASRSQALQQLTHQSVSLLKVTGSGVSNLNHQSSSGAASVSGRIHQSNTTLKLHYGTSGNITMTRTIKLSKAKHHTSGHLAARLWAQHEVDKLSLAKKRNRSTIVRLAKAHHLVTDFTSLIVLDRIEDYVRYRILPPESAMRKLYYQRIKSEKAHDGKKRANLDDIYTSWKELVKWHQTKYPRPLPKIRKPPAPGAAEPASSFIGGGTVASPPSPSRRRRTGADFINPVAFTQVPGIPAGRSQNVTNIATAGLRSGDFATTRNSIDAILNNPNRNNKASASIAIKGWQPNTPYIRALGSAQRSFKPLLPVYYQWKKKHGSTPGFYMDVAGFFHQHGQRREALQILSNLAEITPESPEMLRILAHRCSQMGEYVLAEKYMREVLEMRSEEPQSHRDLALVLIHRKRYQEASDLLWEVVARGWSDSRWGSRFDGIQLIALNEWNWLRKHHGSRIRLRASQKRFVYAMDADVRVVISWDTDNSDMDLWVTDPKGVKCYYANRTTRNGGHMSRDVTQGRGPEEFLIRRAIKGKYKIQANYYGTTQQTMIGPTTLHATVITNWGKPNEKRKHITLRLGKNKAVIDIGEVDL